MQVLTDGILVRDEADMALVVAKLEAAGLTLTDKDRQWLDSRIKRRAPTGTVMQANVRKGLQEFEGKVCPLTGEPVITEKVWQVYHQQGVADIMLDGKLYNTWDLTAGETCAAVDVVAGCCTHLTAVLCSTQTVVVGCAVWFCAALFCPVLCNAVLCCAVQCCAPVPHLNCALRLSSTLNLLVALSVVACF